MFFIVYFPYGINQAKIPKYIKTLTEWVVKNTNFRKKDD